MNGIPSIVTNDFYIPASAIFIPGSSNNFMLKFAIFAKVIFVAELLKVKADFVWSRVYCRPWWIRFEAPGVSMCGYVTGTAISCCEEQKTSIWCVLTLDTCSHAMYLRLHYFSRIGQVQIVQRNAAVYMLGVIQTPRRLCKWSWEAFHHAMASGV